MSSDKVAWNPPRRRPTRSLFTVLAAAAMSLLFINLPCNELDASSTDAMPEWEDNTWPYFSQIPWDIEKDFHYPRTLEFDVE